MFPRPVGRPPGRMIAHEWYATIHSHIAPCRCRRPADHRSGRGGAVGRPVPARRSRTAGQRPDHHGPALPDRGLLPPPHLDGRTGWYDESHLSRLRLIARLQQQGHSLAGIGDLIDQWEHGRDLDAVIGVEAGLDALLGDPHAVTLSAEELAGRFPPGALTPDVMRRAVELGLVEVADDGAVHVPDRRFVETGSELAHLGVPVAAVLDDWEALVDRTDEIAALFVGRFEKHLAPADWSADLDSDRGPRARDRPRPPAPDGAPGRRRRPRRQPRPGWPRPTRAAARGCSGAGARVRSPRSGASWNVVHSMFVGIFRWFCVSQ